MITLAMCLLAHAFVLGVLDETSKKKTQTFSAVFMIL